MKFATKHTDLEENAVNFLYGRLGVMTLIKDKDGKPIRYEKKYPTIEQLIKGCKKEGIKFGVSLEVPDILLAMVRAAYNNPQRDASANMAIKSLSERILQIAIKDAGEEAGVSTEDKSEPVDQKEAETNKKEAEDVKKYNEALTTAMKVAEQANIQIELARIETRQANLETEQAKIKTKQVTIDAEQVQIVYERTELEMDPEKNTKKLFNINNVMAKKEAEQDDLRTQLSELSVIGDDLVKHSIELQKKKDKSDQEATKKDKK